MTSANRSKEPVLRAINARPIEAATMTTSGTRCSGVHDRNSLTGEPALMSSTRLSALVLAAADPLHLRPQLPSPVRGKLHPHRPGGQEELHLPAVANRVPRGVERIRPSSFWPSSGAAFTTIRAIPSRIQASPAATKLRSRASEPSGDFTRAPSGVESTAMKTACVPRMRERPTATMIVLDRRMGPSVRFTTGTAARRRRGPPVPLSR